MNEMRGVALTTILLPVYNGMPYIEATIQSVIAQTERNWNLIISDNNSNDGTYEFLTSLTDKRITVIRQSVNIGAPKNWEYLYNICTTEYACFLGADDILNPIFIERLESVITKSSDIAFVHSASDLIDGNGFVIGKYSQSLSEKTSKSDFLSKQFLANQVNVTSCLFSIKKAKEQGVKFDATLFLLFDWALWFDIQLHFSVSIYLDEILCQYRQHESNTTARTINGPRWTIDSARIILERIDCVHDEYVPTGVRKHAIKLLCVAVKKSLIKTDFCSAVIASRILISKFSISEITSVAVRNVKKAKFLNLKFTHPKKHS